MKSPAFNAFLVTALSIAAHSAQASATTDPVGAMMLEFPAESDTYVSLAFHRPEAFRGTVADVIVNADTIDVQVAGSPDWAADAFTSGNDTYYMLIANGPLDGNNQPDADESQEGAWVTVTGNGTDTLTFDRTEFEYAISDSTDLLDLNGDNTNDDGVTIKVIPFWTPASLFPDTSEIETAAFPFSPGNATRLLIPRKAGSGSDQQEYNDSIGVNKTFLIDFMYVSQVGVETWRNASLVSDTTDYANYVLLPDSNVIVRNSHPTRSLNVVHYGAVGLTAFRVQVGTFEPGTQQDNPIAYPFPVSKTLSELNLFESGAIRPSNFSFSPNGDQLLVYSNNQTKLNPTPSAFYHYASAPVAGWYTLAGVSADDATIEPGDTLVVRRNSDQTPTQADWIYLPDTIKDVSSR